ncbi:MAG: hypothetical protein ACRD9Q_01475 [Nitrososphaeraceae archaeon]
MKTRLIISIIGLVIVSGILISTSGIFTPLESDLAECSYTDDNEPPRPCRIIDGWYDALFHSEPLPLVEPDIISNQKCAELFDKIFDTWEKHVKENYGGPGQPTLEPPTVTGLVSGWEGGEEFRNTDCRYRVNDWAYLVIHQEQVWGYVDWPKLEPFAYHGPVSFGKLTSKTISGQVQSVDMDDSSHILVGTQNGNHNGSLYYFDDTGTIIWQEEIDKIIASVDISRDGKFVTAASYEITDGRVGIYYDNLIYFFDNSGQMLWSYPERQVSTSQDDIDYASYGYDVTEDGNKIIISFEDKIKLFDNQGDEVWENIVQGEIRSIKISTKEDIIIVGTGQIVQDGDWALNAFTKEGNQLWQKSGLDGQIISGDGIDVSSNGSYVALGLGSSGDNGTLYVFDKLGSLKWRDDINSVVSHTYFSEDEKHLLASTNEGFRFYDMNGVLLWKQDNVFYPAISSEYIVGVSPVGASYLLEVFDYDGNLIVTHPIEKAVRSIVISDDSKLIVVGTGDSEMSVGTVYYFTQVTRG